MSQERDPWEQQSPASQPDLDPWEQQPTPTRTLPQEAGRQGLMLARALASAAASPFTLAGDVANKAINAVAPSANLQMPSSLLQRGLTSLGLPEPTSLPEHLTVGMGQSAPATLLPAAFIPQVLGNAAVSSTLAPPGSELSAASLGGVLGAGGHVLARALGGLRPASPAVADAVAAGLPLSPGQMAGGAANRVEQMLASNPISGPVIAPLRAAGRQALPSVELSAAGVPNLSPALKPNELATATREHIDSLYQAAFDKIPDVQRPSAHFLLNLAAHSAIAPNVAPMLTEAQAAQITRWAANRLPGNEPLTAAHLKQLDAELGQHIRNLYAGTAEERAAIPAWEAVQDSFRFLLPGMDEANAAYRRVLPFLKELDKAGPMMPTPYALRRAVQRTGQAPSATLRTAEEVLPATVPSSGTAERLIINALPSLLVGGGAGAQQLGWDTLGTGAMVAGALGTQTGRRALMGQLPYQQAVVNALRRTVPTVAAQSQQE